MLHRLARTAAPGSEERIFAHRQLAELLAERNPWRAALYARRVVSERPDDDRGWALLGLSQTLLGHYRFAASAYQRALACSPKNPWYAHNLGHLLDVALDRAGDAVQWLRIAYKEAVTLGHGASGDVAASFAHALARSGRVRQARQVLQRTQRVGLSSREHDALMDWLDRGAPPEEDAGGPGAHAARGRPARATARRVRATPPARHVEDAATRALHHALTRGLDRLPLDDKQRERARELAAAAGVDAGEDASARAAAAAIAYAMVFVDRVPLSPAEVAATFRVSPAALRGRFGELRARLDLTPGDLRYATRTT
jgi:tetratricopeptide (TPR) repeat protein